jgi:hypothetical protein
MTCAVLLCTYDYWWLQAFSWLLVEAVHGIGGAADAALGRQAVGHVLIVDCSLRLTITAFAAWLVVGTLCRRQVGRWSKQYMASVVQPMPSVLRLVSWLQGNVPAEDTSPPAPAVVHGDFRLDNLVYDEQLQVRL